MDTEELNENFVPRKVWSSDEIQTIINFVRDRPFLYNKKHEDYKHSNLKDKAWGEIAQLLNSKTARECKRKWNTLRIQQRRIVKQKLKKRGRQIQWHCFSSLQFLVPHMELTSGISLKKEDLSDDEQNGEYIEEKHADYASVEQQCLNSPIPDDDVEEEHQQQQEEIEEQKQVQPQQTIIGFEIHDHGDICQQQMQHTQQISQQHPQQLQQHPQQLQQHHQQQHQQQQHQQQQQQQQHHPESPSIKQTHFTTTISPATAEQIYLSECTTSTTAPIPIALSSCSFPQHTTHTVEHSGSPPTTNAVPVSSTIQPSITLSHSGLSYFLMDVQQHMERLNELAQMELKIDIQKLILEKLRNSENCK